jgi:GNAT superfamily N-acetyltransferase
MRRNIDVEVRRARRADVPGIVRLWHELIEHHRPFDPYLRRRPQGSRIFGNWVRKYIGSRKQLALVAECQGRPVGYALAHIRNMPLPIWQKAYVSISDMCVTESARRKGTGRRMLREVEKWARCKGLARLEVGYLPKNRHAFSFWHKMGFKPIRHTGLKWIGRGGR